MSVCPPHYWLLESPKGPTSEGRCRWCGATRTFSNVEPQASFYGHGRPQGKKKP